MTEEHRQRLSQLVDGELDSGSASRLLNALEDDSGLKAVWERYHLIGQALRREPIAISHRAIAVDVRTRLTAEPTLLVPQRPRRLQRRNLQRLAGVSMAASVALAAFLGAPVLFQSPTSAPDPQYSDASDADAQIADRQNPAPQNPAPRIADVRSDAPRLVERESIPMRRLQRERPELANKLDLYLVTHQATAPATGAKGMLPYATLVGYETAR
ncbi:sigma-E factor negative regulatory protein [Thiocystis violacea]|uniref:sigma-E factor negative regulatory protein n=1 Tax=Thiocystis violacea TaxID=13725 RepID=UPI0019042DC9|nr:sigma-E factor negative regulatory protein [Thiocystis violacea]MBK1724486.1 hypothetical protein [Thiocystis violacea]